jgi:hypothetical protein
MKTCLALLDVYSVKQITCSCYVKNAIRKRQQRNERMREEQNRIRAIHAYYSEMSLAEVYKEIASTDNYLEDKDSMTKKAESHYNTAQRLKDYITVQFKADIDKLPTMEEFLKSE